MGDELLGRREAVLPVLARPVDTRAEYEHEPPCQHRRDDVREVIVGDLRRRRALETRFLPQDRAVEPLQGRARLDAELVDECAAGVEVGLERLGLPPGAIEREHQLAAQPLAQRVLSDERLELADELGAGTLLEVGVDALLERVEPQLRQPADLARRERLEGKVRQGRAAPERERVAQQLGARARLESPCTDDELLEAAQVEGVGVDLDAVAGRLRDERVRRQNPA